jgi:DNA gyrase subunit A
MGRATQGVRLIRLDDTDSISDIAVVDREEEELIDIEPINDNEEGSDDPIISDNQE